MMQNWNGHCALGFRVQGVSGSPDKEVNALEGNKNGNRGLWGLIRMITNIPVLGFHLSQAAQKRGSCGLWGILGCRFLGFWVYQDLAPESFVLSPKGL